MTSATAPAAVPSRRPSGAARTPRTGSARSRRRSSLARSSIPGEAARKRRLRRALARGADGERTAARPHDEAGLPRAAAPQHPGGHRSVRPRRAHAVRPVVRDWYSKLTVTAGADQAAKSYRLLRAILNTAVDDELIARNPCRIRGGGAEHADERPMIDAELVFRLAHAITPGLRALVIVAGFAGLRTGELPRPPALRRRPPQRPTRRPPPGTAGRRSGPDGDRTEVRGRSTDGEPAQARRRGAGEAPGQLRSAGRGRRALHGPARRASHAGAAVEGVASPGRPRTLPKGCGYTTSGITQPP